MNLEEQVSQSLMDSVMDAFSTTLFLDLQKVEQEQEQLTGGIIGSIGFTGTLEGNLALYFSDQSACAVVSKMLGMQITEVNTDVHDGIGEIANMVIGGIKMKLAESGHKFEIGIPTIITGEEMHVLARKEDLIRVRQSFTCEEIKFSAILIYKECEYGDEEAEAMAAFKKSNAKDALDRLNQLVGNSPAEAQNQDHLSDSSEKKDNPLEALQAAASRQKETSREAKKDFNQASGVTAHLNHVATVQKKSSTKVETPAQEVKKSNPLDILNAAVASKSQASQNQASSTASGEPDKQKTQEKQDEELSAVDKLNQVMKTFKEFKP